jgi:sulfate adenylyltransferase subunit 1 (EFTu-like GTPase family)
MIGASQNWLIGSSNCKLLFILLKARTAVFEKILAYASSFVLPYIHCSTLQVLVRKIAFNFFSHTVFENSQNNVVDFTQLRLEQLNRQTKNAHILFVKLINS